ncbi:hypothetical protein DW322_03710 [Rhodococcus rhodnii]|uniref:Uncharacterized protein n=2 Tax=Rhodococcus rhodnii TaxID=38312 RepID=R7WMU3_9NOCA|nr:hypothetical protein [Rhodococcus rhodnii]EOM76615.1 hypothetical protein Rrhod_2012 [Rhodococcus rhodnii LMG 5362]TXG89493.1 hypothetical protein DW322_03710 [Rhodococcus rhodnii]
MYSKKQAGQPARLPAAMWGTVALAVVALSLSVLQKLDVIAWGDPSASGVFGTLGAGLVTYVYVERNLPARSEALRYVAALTAAVLIGATAWFVVERVL